MAKRKASTISIVELLARFSTEEKAVKWMVGIVLTAAVSLGAYIDWLLNWLVAA